MTTGISFVDNMEQVRSLLALAPHFEGEKHLERNDFPNRYVWVYETISAQGAQGAGGRPPRPIDGDTFRTNVHCWGKTFAHALYLRQCLATALREVYKGGNAYKLTSTDIVGDRAHTANGYCLVVKIDTFEQLVEVDLTKCGECLAQMDAPRTGQANRFEIESPDAEPGDGWIDAKEP